MYYSWDVIGHERQLASLETDFRENNLHHAYLFVGPEKIGKFRIAKAAAGILQCPNNYCHKCPACIQVIKHTHPDTIELVDDGESIKIDTIRDIIMRLSMTGQSQYKILLIENIGRLTDEAANCLLKILEEPLGKTVFIFTAANLRTVLPTITSRMRVIHFKMLPNVVLKQALKDKYPDTSSEMLEQVLSLSLGRSGRAIQLLSDPESFRELHELYSQIHFLETKASLATRLIAMQELSKDPQKTRQFLGMLSHYFRKALFEKDSFDEKIRIVRILQEIHRVIDLLARNVNPRLLLENIMLQL